MCRLTYRDGWKTHVELHPPIRVWVIARLMRLFGFQDIRIDPV